MSNDYEKAAILAKLKSEFQVKDELLNILLKQIKSPEIRNNFPRIKRGLSYETAYQDLFSTFPWIKNLHGLDQKQSTNHKKDYQVPDFSAFIEDNSKNRFPILIEVKSVNKNKEIFEIMPKQKLALLNYAREENKVIVLAIYWEKYNFWTHTVLSALTGKKKNKFTLEEAIKNDIGHILSDYTFLIRKKIYRKTVFSDTEHNANIIHHAKYGKIVDIKLSTDGKNFLDIDTIYSAVIDSVIPMTEVSYENNELLEVYDSGLYITLSTWILRYLALWKIDGNTETELKDSNQNSMNYYTLARYAIVDLMAQLQIKNSYLIPEIKNQDTDTLFEMAYKDSSVYKNYLQQA